MKKPRKPRKPKDLAALKRTQQAFYRKNRKRLLAYANAYYADHKEEVLAKAKVRYAKKRKDYFCKVCGKKLSRELSGHYHYCDKCRVARRIRSVAKSNKKTKK